MERTLKNLLGAQADSVTLAPFLHMDAATTRVAPMHAAHNARVQLLATLLNNISLAFIVPGFVAPAVSGQMQAGWHVSVTTAWTGFGVGLHSAARAMLGRVRE